jgi:hypothetical protein
MERVMSGVYRYLTSDGLAGSGSNHDITGAADVHWTGPPAGETWELHRIIINIRDAGTVNADTFGGLSALTNGCTLKVKRGGSGGNVTLDLLDGTTIKNNGDLARHAYDMNISAATAGDKAVTARWTFSKAGEPLKIVGNLNEVLVIETQDATTGLAEFTVMAHGRKV